MRVCRRIRRGSRAGAVAQHLPDGADRQDELAHRAARLRPTASRSAGDVRLDLRWQGPGRTGPRAGLEVVGLDGDGHRVAGEGHGDARARASGGSRALSGDAGTRRDPVDLCLDRPPAVVTQALRRARAGTGVVDSRISASVDFHYAPTGVRSLRRGGDWPCQYALEEACVGSFRRAARQRIVRELDDGRAFVDRAGRGTWR